MLGHKSERLLLMYVSLKKQMKHQPLILSNLSHVLALAASCLFELGREQGWFATFRIGCWGLRDLLVRKTRLLFPFRYPYARLRFALSLRPLSYLWGLDRGVPIHRHYLADFLRDCSSDIRGHCLEFQEDSYTSQLGGERVTKSDILHQQPGNANATIVADITRPNNIPSNEFDCIICTYVLNVIFEVDKAVSQLYRILKPGGALLIAVPQASMCDPEWHDVWRFTTEGLHLLLGRVFGAENVTVRAYGNSLTAAADLRGLVTDELIQRELDYHDPRFAMVVCARAIKGTQAPVL
jgi:hypothetical protein